MVGSHKDEFTDAVHAVALSCLTEDYSDIFQFRYTYDGGHMDILLSASDQALDDDASVDVRLRVGKHPSIDLTGVWRNSDNGIGGAVVSFEDSIEFWEIFAQLADGAERLIYRIGDGGVIRVPIADDISELIDELVIQFVRGFSGESSPELERLLREQFRQWREEPDEP